VSSCECVNVSKLLLETDEKKFCFGRVLEITDYHPGRYVLQSISGRLQSIFKISHI